MMADLAATVANPEYPPELRYPANWELLVYDVRYGITRVPLCPHPGCKWSMRGWPTPFGEWNWMCPRHGNEGVIFGVTQAGAFTYVQARLESEVQQ
jgi:hypothetical protein